jgi:hypothetical protein
MDVTITSARTVLRKISCTFFGNAADPPTSNPYSPTKPLRTELRAPLTHTAARRTVVEDDGEARAPERLEKRGGREQHIGRVPEPRLELRPTTGP